VFTLFALETESGKSFHIFTTLTAKREVTKRISKAQFNGRFTRCCLCHWPNKNASSDCLKRLYEQVWLSEVRRQIVSRLEVQLHWRLCRRRSWCASDWREAYTSVSRAQSSWTSVGDEAAVVSWECGETTPGGQGLLPWTRRAAAMRCLTCVDCEGIVEDAIMLGAPVTGSADEWQQLARVVSGRVVNGYSRCPFYF